MSRLVKILFGIALVLFGLSYPVCQLNERTVQSEMAKYPKEFVEAHYFDWVFLKHVMPGITMFFLAAGFLFVATVVWIVEWLVKRTDSRS